MPFADTLSAEEEKRLSEIDPFKTKTPAVNTTAMDISPDEETRLAAIDPFRTAQPATTTAIPTTAIPQDRSLMGELVGGVKRSVPQFKETYANVAGALGAISGIDALKDYGLSKAKEYAQETKEVAPPAAVPSIVESYQKGDTLKDLPYWLASQVGEQAMNIGETALTAIAGGLIGSAVGPEGTLGGVLAGATSKGFIKKIAAKTMQEIAEGAIKKGATKEAALVAASQLPANLIGKKLGAMAGVVAGTIPLEWGGNYGEQVEKGMDDRKAALTTFATAIPAGFLELAGGGSRLIGKILNPVTKFETEAAQNIFKRFGKNLLGNLSQQMPEEFLQEAGQEFLSVVSSKLNDPTVGLLNKQSMLRYLEAGLAGAGIGGVFGLSGATIDALKKPKTIQRQQEEQKETTSAIPTDIDITPEEKQDTAATKPVDLTQFAPKAEEAPIPPTEKPETTPITAIPTEVQQPASMKPIDLTLTSEERRQQAEEQEVEAVVSQEAIVSPVEEIPPQQTTAIPASVAASQQQQAAIRPMQASEAEAPRMTAIDMKAHEAAASPLNAIPEPTEAQKEAGNYKKGHINLQGLDISIENPEGSKRTGVSPGGKKWETEMKSHYGYILGTKGKDKDHIDAFVGKNPDSEQVFVVNQINPDTGKFDEHKVMLGFNNVEDAKTGYLENYEKGWKGIKDIVPMFMDEFKEWIKGNTTKPATPKSAMPMDASKAEAPNIRQEQAISAIPVIQQSEMPRMQAIPQGQNMQPPVLPQTQQVQPAQPKEAKQKQTAVKQSAPITFTDKQGNIQWHRWITSKGYLKGDYYKPELFGKGGAVESNKMLRFTPRNGNKGKQGFGFDQLAQMAHAEGLIKDSHPETLLAAMKNAQFKHPGYTEESTQKEAEARSSKQGFSVGDKVKVGKQPISYTIVKVLEQTPQEQKLGERYYEVQDNKGRVETIEESDIYIKKSSKIAAQNAIIEKEERDNEQEVSERISEGDKKDLIGAAANELGRALGTGRQEQAVEQRNATAVRTEETAILKKWAANNGLLIPHEDFTRTWIAQGKKEGGEHQRIHLKEDDIVLKRKSLSLQETYSDYLKALEIHNTLTPAKYTLKGFSDVPNEETGKEGFMPVVEQPFIDGTPAPTDKIHEFMLKAGFKKVAKGKYYDDFSGILISDLEGNEEGPNAVLDKNGNVVLIDPQIEFAEGIKIPKEASKEKAQSVEQYSLTSSEEKKVTRKPQQNDMFGFSTALEGKLPSQEMTEDMPLETAKKEAEARKEVKEKQTNLSFQIAQPFYSQLERTVSEIRQEKFTPEQLQGMLRGKVKVDEITDIGLDEFLKDKKFITKQELLDYIKANKVEVKSVKLGGKTLDEISKDMGYDGWSERLTPEQKNEVEAEYKRQGSRAGALQFDSPAYRLPGGDEGTYREEFLTLPNAPIKSPVKYTKGNWAENMLRNVAEESRYSHGISWHDGHPAYADIVNPIVRMRYDERAMPNGDKVGTVYEFQPPSKENQAKMPEWARKRWRELGAKHMLRVAAERGWTHLTWATGEQVAGFYDLSKHVGRISYRLVDANNIPTIPTTQSNQYYRISVFGKNDESLNLNVPTRLKADDLDQYVGKEIALKIINDATLNEQNISGLDLKIGGEGIKRLYDIDMVNVFNALGKPFGVKVGELNIGDVGIKKQNATRYKGPTLTIEDVRELAKEDDANTTIIANNILKSMENGTPFKPAIELHGSIAFAEKIGGTFDWLREIGIVHSLPITPELVRSVMEVGQPLFQSGTPQIAFRITQSQMSDIIREIQRIAAPGSKVDFRNMINKDTATMQEALQKWGKGEIDSTVRIKGSHDIGVDITGEHFISMIELSLSDMDMTTPYHEAFHSVHELLLRPEEKDFLEKAYPEKDGVVSEEQQAEAFADYVLGRRADMNTRVKIIFAKIKSFFDKLKNYLNGKGFYSVNDMFEKAYQGEYAKREMKARSVSLLKGLSFQISQSKTTPFDILKNTASREDLGIKDEDMTVLERYYSNPWHLAKKFPKLADFISAQMERMQQRSEMLLDFLKSPTKKREGQQHEFLSLSKSDRTNIEPVMIYSDAMNHTLSQEEINSPDTLRKVEQFFKDNFKETIQLNQLNDAQRLAYYSWKSSMDKALKLKREHAEKMLFQQYEGKSWLDTLKKIYNDKSTLIEAKQELSIDDFEELEAAYEYLKEDMTTLKQLRNEMGERKYYVPRKREYGRYVISAYEEGNKQPVWSERTKSSLFDKAERMQAAAIRDELKKEYPNAKIKIELQKTTPESVYQEMSDIDIEKFVADAFEKIKAGKVIDNTELAGIRKALFSTLADELKARGWAKHMIRRLQTKRGKVIAGYQTRDLNDIYVGYMSGLVGSLTKQDAAFKFMQAMKDIDYHKEKELYEYAKNYSRDMLRNASNLDRLSGKASSFAFVWYLSGNLRMIPVQFTQNFVTGIPILSQATKGASFKYIKAMRDVALGNVSEDEKAALSKAFDEGIVNDQYMREIIGRVKGTKLGQMFSKILDFLAWPFTMMETYNRKSAFLAMYRVALKEKGMNEVDAFNKARDFVYDTHFLYGKANLPEWARGASAGSTVARTAYTFRSFTHNYLLAMKHSLKGEGGKLALGTIGRSLAYLAVFGGLSAMPFLDDLLDQIERMTGYPFRAKMKAALKNTGGDMLEKVGMAGLPALLGFDLSGSLKINLAKPSLAGVEESVIGVYGGILNKMMKSMEAFALGEPVRGIELIAPVALENIMKAYREMSEGVVTPYGKVIFDDKGKLIKLTEWEAAGRALGFRPERIAGISTKHRSMQNVQEHYRSVRDKLYDRWALASIPERPAIMKDVKAYNESVRQYRGFVPRITRESLIQSYRRRRRPEKQFMRFGKAMENES